MRPLNLINSIYYNNYNKQALKQWYKISALFVITTFAIVSYFQIKQLITFFSLKREYLVIEQFITNQKEQSAKKTKLIQRKEELKRRYSKLTYDSTLYTYMLLIAQLVPHDSHLTEFKYTKKQNIILKGQARAYQSLTSFIRNLSQNNKLPHVSLSDARTDSKTNNLSYEIQIDL